LTGKGDGIVRLLEFSGGNFHYCGNEYKSNVPGKSYAFLPKYCMNTGSEEVARLIKAEETKIV
jgi:hypothetical protein